MLQSVIFDYRSYCICSLGNHERDLLFAKREDNEKTEAVYMDSFLQKSAMREKRKWGGAVVIIQEGSMMGEGFILIL